jgi:hypothetical protein
MLGNLYPFWAAISANLIAQLIKPVFRYFSTGKWEYKLLVDSGGFPSSHTSTVTALSLAVGIQEKFSSTLFAVVLMFSLIVMYDAANVRYYAGRNIQITQQLIRDIQTLTTIKLDDPVYLLKVKEVLGHQWFEVFGGAVLGLLVASLMFFMR